MRPRREISRVRAIRDACEREAATRAILEVAAQTSGELALRLECTAHSDEAADSAESSEDEICHDHHIAIEDRPDRAHPAVRNTRRLVAGIPLLTRTSPPW
jgi:hypothetical protein